MFTRRKQFTIKLQSIETGLTLLFYPDADLGDDIVYTVSSVDMLMDITGIIIGYFHKPCDSFDEALSVALSGYGRTAGYEPPEMDKSTVDEDANLHYPEDPILRPMATLILNEEKNIVVNFYLYSIVAICSPDKTFICRMD